MIELQNIFKYIIAERNQQKVFLSNACQCKFSEEAFGMNLEYLFHQPIVILFLNQQLDFTQGIKMST